MFKILFSALALATAATAYTNDALNDLVSSLPGTESLDIPFKQFSGSRAMIIIRFGQANFS